MNGRPAVVLVMNLDALDGRVAGYRDLILGSNTSNASDALDERVAGLPGLVILANSNGLDKRVTGCRLS